MKKTFLFLVIASFIASCNDETSSKTDTPARNYDSITIDAEDTSNTSLQTDTLTNKQNTEKKNKPADEKTKKKSRTTRA